MHQLRVSFDLSENGGGGGHDVDELYVHDWFISRVPVPRKPGSINPTERTLSWFIPTELYESGAVLLLIHVELEGEIMALRNNTENIPARKTLTFLYH